MGWGTPKIRYNKWSWDSIIWCNWILIFRVLFMQSFSFFTLVFTLLRLQSHYLVCLYGKIQHSSCKIVPPSLSEMSWISFPRFFLYALLSTSMCHCGCIYLVIDILSYDIAISNHPCKSNFILSNATNTNYFTIFLQIANVVNSY